MVYIEGSRFHLCFSGAVAMCCTTAICTAGDLDCDVDDYLCDVHSLIL
jgi:hypothetical protein